MSRSRESLVSVLVPSSPPLPSEIQKAFFSTLVAAICWSFGAYLVCILTELPVLQLASMTQIAGALISMLLEGRIPHIKKLAYRLFSGWTILALFICNQATYLYAFRSAPAAHVDLINYLWPAMLVIAQSMKTQTGLKKRQIAGLILSVFGLFVLLSEELFKTSTQIIFLPGYLAAFAAAISWTLYSIFSTNHSDRDGEDRSISSDILLSGMALGALHTLMGSWVWPESADWLIIIALATLNYGIAHPLWRRSLKVGYYTMNAATANAIPLLSIAWLILGGIVANTYNLWLATLFISIGGYLLNHENRSLAMETNASTTV